MYLDLVNIAKIDYFQVNHMDLAPNFSGTLMTLGNTGMNIFNVLLPILISYVVTDVVSIVCNDYVVLFCKPIFKTFKVRALLKESQVSS